MLENTETDLLLGPNLLEGNQSDPLFSRMHLRFGPNISVRLYDKNFHNHTKRVFRAVVAEITLVPAGRTKFLAALIPNWKRTRVTLNAVFEPKSNNSPETISLFQIKCSNTVIPIAVENEADSAVKK